MKNSETERMQSVGDHTISYSPMTDENEMEHATVSINYSDSNYYVSFDFASNDDALAFYQALSKMRNMDME